MPNAAATVREAGTVDAWAALLASLAEPTWVVALDGLRVVACNAAACSLLQRSRDELLASAADELLPTPEDMAYWAAVVEDGQAAPLLSDTVLALPGGGLVHLRRSIRALGVPGQLPRHCTVSVSDRSQEARADAEHELTLAELQATLESTADGILVTEVDGRIRAFNRRFAELFQLPPELLGAAQGEALLACVLQRLCEPATLSQALNPSPTNAAPPPRLALKNGGTLERASRPFVCRGQAMGQVHAFRDLSERLAVDARLQALALTDGLTGLPNRRQLALRLSQAAAAAPEPSPGFALLLVDLDRFRQLNDSLGREAGDAVLQEVSRRIQRNLRQSDLLVHLGADQFVLFIERADEHAAAAAARRVLDTVSQPCRLADAEFTLTCSVGAALSPAHGRGLDELMRHAETAVREVKDSGRAGYRLHASAAGGRSLAELQLDHAMRQALAAGRFRLHYQPQVSLEDGRFVGAEALLRWVDPKLSQVSPGRLIAVAEASGFIVPLGDWVLVQAVQQLRCWHEHGIELPIAINVSALQFRQPDFVERVAGVLAAGAVPPQRLELELTESILVHDADAAMQRLQALAALGVKLSIDDFGTGYSSLTYLKRVPIGKLKIDRSFVMGLPGDGSDAGIVRAIVQMAAALGLRCVAEGVETEAQRQFLLGAGCQEFQGFLCAPALEPSGFEARLLAAPGG